MEAALRRHRLLVGLGLVLVTALAWVWTLTGAGLPMGTEGGSGPHAGGLADAAMTVAPWSLGHAALMLTMWWVMMVAMMMPSAAPFLLLATSIHRREGAAGRSSLPTALLGLGYLVAWGGFSVLATAAQWGLHSAGALSGGMALGPALGGAVLVGAGLYQLTPAKRACLRTCRSPMAFLVAHWRPGAAGALRLGLTHGVYCVGCCWALMALLFVGGIMNPLWIGGIALFVLLEKLAPGGERLRRAAGLLLLAGGAWMWLAAL